MPTRDHPRSDIQRIRRRFHDEGVPKFILWIVVLGSIALLTLMDEDRVWLRIALQVELAVICVMLVSTRFSAFFEDRRLRSDTPRERRIIRPKVWEAVARRTGLDFRGGRRPELAGHYETVDLTVRFHGGEVFETRIVVPHPSRFDPRMRLFPAGGRSPGSEITGDRDFDSAFEGWVKPTAAAGILLDEEVRKRLLDLEDVQVEIDLSRTTVRTSGFEGDEDRLVALLDLAVAIALRREEAARP